MSSGMVLTSGGFRILEKSATLMEVTATEQCRQPWGCLPEFHEWNYV
jgi:hypothetical protein